MSSVTRPGDITLPYAVVGPVDGPRMLYAHSLTANGVDSAAWVQPLVDDGWQVALMDQRGHGGATRVTDPSSYALSHFATDYVAVLDDLGWEKAWFAGGSMGAATAIAAAALAPERVEGIALIAPAFGPSTNAAAAMFAEIAAAFDRGMDAGVAAWRERLGDQQVGQVLPLGAENLACMLRVVPAWQLDLDSVGQVDGPVRVVAWKDDDIHPWSLAEEIVDRAKNGCLAQATGDFFADLAALLRSGHGLQQKRPKSGAFVLENGL